MKPMVNIKIDGVHIRVPKGTSVLDAAMKYGICIPHLCHVPCLADIGACRLCIVEQVMNGAPKVTTSCTLLAQEEMVIFSNTDRVRALRRNLAELLVAQAPNSKAIQDIAVRCGVSDVRYPFRNDDCVLCGRCVRICTELVRANAIGFVGRGKDREVASPFHGKPESCKRCMYCVAQCPMSIPPCGGTMKRGEERLCGQCASKMTIAEQLPDTCVWCDLGESSFCSRYVGW